MTKKLCIPLLLTLLQILLLPPVPAGAAPEANTRASLAISAPIGEAPTQAEQAGSKTVSIYFGNSNLDPQIADCGKVYPVTRRISATSTEEEIGATLASLFAGPTEAERAGGYVSMFSDATASILLGYKVEGDTAYLNVRDIRQVIPNASTACGATAFFAEVETTLKDLLPIGRVIYGIQGDPAAFYDWMQLGCNQDIDVCDRRPFADPRLSGEEGGGTGNPGAPSSFEFKLGFRALASEIPEVVGEPLENEWHNPENGDGLQRTTAGMMVWWKADNWTAFTDGYRTWVNGPYGVQERLNGERFKWEVPSTPEDLARPIAPDRTSSVLADHLIVSWYGNPHTGLMGVLGQFTGEDLAGRLQRQADAYAPLTDKRILPAYELIAVVAQGSAGSDEMWRRRESYEVIDSMLQEARAHGFVLILDVQVGRSRVEDELEYLRPYLEQPDVYLAIDPEFDMWPGQAPGQQIGHTVSAEVNYAIDLLQGIITDKGLPPKVLILHQFTLNMLPDKERIVDSPVVDLVLDMDGFGAQWLKLDTYRSVMQQKQLEFAGIKLFYDHDPGLFTPEQVMKLDPTPSLVIYQ